MVRVNENFRRNSLIKAIHDIMGYRNIVLKEFAVNFHNKII